MTISVIVVPPLAIAPPGRQAEIARVEGDLVSPTGDQEVRAGLTAGGEGDGAVDAGPGAARQPVAPPPVEAVQPDLGSRHGLAAAVKHTGVVEEEQCILDTGEAGTLTALDDNDIACLVSVQDRHAVDRTRVRERLVHSLRAAA